MSTGGGYGGMGGFGGGFPPPPMFGGGFGGGFGSPQQSFYNPFSGYYGNTPQYGGGFGQPQMGGFGQFQMGGFGQPQMSGFGQPFGGFQTAPQQQSFQQQQPFQQQPFQQQTFQQQPFQQQSAGNVYAQRFARVPEPMASPDRQALQPAPPAGSVENPSYSPIPEGMIGTMGPERIRYMPSMPPNMTGGLGSLLAGFGYPQQTVDQSRLSGFDNLFGGGNQLAQQQQQMLLQSQQLNPTQPPPGMMLNPNYNRSRAMQEDLPRGPEDALSRQMYIPSMTNTYFNPMSGREVTIY